MLRNKLSVLVLVLTFSPVTFAELKIFSSEQAIKAQDVNHNFTHIKNLFSLKDISIPFDVVEAGGLIRKDFLEEEFSKVREYNVIVSPLGSSKIQSRELNLAFSQMQQGALSYNSAPLINSANVETDINTESQVSLNITNHEDDALDYQILQQGAKGTASIKEGKLVYTPSLNQYGSDSFQLRVSDGEKQSNLITVPVSIIGKGIVENSGVRTYFDGSAVSTCNEYLTSNVENKHYWGKTGSGVYKLQVGGENLNVYCDMERDGGGWTLAVRIGDMNAPASLSTGAMNLGSLNSPVVVGAGAGFYAKLSDAMINSLRSKQSNKAAYRVEVASSPFTQNSGGRKLFYPGSCEWVVKGRYIQSTHPECTKRSLVHDATVFSVGADVGWCNQPNMTRHYFCSGAAEGFTVVTGWESYPWHNWPHHLLWIR